MTTLTSWLLTVLSLSFLQACSEPGPTPTADADGTLDADEERDQVDSSPDADADLDEDGEADADEDGEADREADADRGADAEADADRAADADEPLDGGSDADAGPPTPSECFDAIFSDASLLSLDYDRFGPTMGSHCLGTNHQEFSGIERVVFLGDSLTVGSPPTASHDFYRSRLADWLVAELGLRAPGELWRMYDPFDGTSVVRSAGDFWSCAEWGARADDLLRDGSQIVDCFPESELGKRTLAIITVGGNDISSITQDGLDGLPLSELWDEVYAFVELMRQAIEHLTDPTLYPAGNLIVFGNMFEFTDGTGEVTACPAAGLAGFGADWDDPTALAEMMIWASEQYLSIAVDTRTDMTFMLEHFCGHGWNSDNPDSPCYRGAGAPRWFDLTCIHPNPEGHAELARMFEAVIAE